VELTLTSPLPSPLPSLLSGTGTGTGTGTGQNKQQGSLRQPATVVLSTTLLLDGYDATLVQATVVNKDGHPCGGDVTSKVTFAVPIGPASRESTTVTPKAMSSRLRQCAPYTAASPALWCASPWALRRLG
jgi:hypothetical protein